MTESDIVQWKVLRDLKEAKEDMQQEPSQELLPLKDLVQKITKSDQQ